MDELPELPFELVLSYLSLEDRLKARAVSRRWYHKIKCFRPKCLCYSQRPISRLIRESRWVSGAFAANFISSTRFTSFFDTFGQTILSSLRRLRLCDLDLCGDETAFARTLNSFGQLEQLDIIRAGFEAHISNLRNEFNLNLPMLTSLHLEEVRIKKLTLEAPRLRDVKVLFCNRTHPRLEIVHGESVERLFVDWLGYTGLEENQLYLDYLLSADSTFLSSLPQLKEFHTNDSENTSELFRLFAEKQLSGRVDLKIYFWGLLLNGPDDPAIFALLNRSIGHLRKESLVCLAKNPSALAVQIPFYRKLRYSDIDGVAPGLEVDLLKRCPELREVIVNCPVQDTQRFLDLLKNCENISKLSFTCDQLQELFDRLPEHSDVQKLYIDRPPSDLSFLFRLKRLVHLHIGSSIDSETVRRALEELLALSCFWFKYGQKSVSIETSHRKQFEIWVDNKNKTASDLNASIEFIFGIERPKKRKAEDLE